jgi:hypothetical protein
MIISADVVSTDVGMSTDEGGTAGSGGATRGPSISP